MRTCRLQAMLLAAAACLLGPGISPAHAADWLGGPYWGRISGCAHCGTMMYGYFAVPGGCPCYQPLAESKAAEDASSSTRIVSIRPPRVAPVSYGQPTPAVREEQAPKAEGRCSSRRSKGHKRRGCGGCGGCRGFGRGGGYDGSDPSFNCGCNGSYKFPVPPLYTYHWPGMYSLQLMTDYHSPWRFPPLRPYVDEPEGDYLGENLTPFTPASAVAPLPAERAAHSGSVEPMSEKMRRFYR